MSDMDISDNGLQFIASHEGYSSVVYQDSAGKDSIGFGHLLIPADGNLTSITQDEALTLLHNDCAHAVSCVNECVEVDLNQNQFDACVDLCYNIGGHAFQESTLLKCLNNSDMQGAIEQFLVWDKCNGAVVQGLLNRRKDEQALFIKPTGE